jgi:hypothetical protein
MARIRDEDIDTSEAPDDGGRPYKPAAGKSRALGVFFILLGAAAVGAIFYFDIPSRKVTAALSALGTVGVFMGVGMVLVPWTPKMFALNEQDDFGKLFAAMPVFWKVWFVVSIVAMLGGMFAPLILR